MERKTYNLFDIIYSGTAKYLEPVSYTHLDVYKRQLQICRRSR